LVAHTISYAGWHRSVNVYTLYTAGSVFGSGPAQNGECLNIPLGITPQLGTLQSPHASEPLN